MRNSLIVIWRALSSLSAEKLFRLFKLQFMHPLFCILTFFATLKAYRLAKKLYPETSNGNGVGNAFRHGLWTCLILSYCCKISSPKKANKWCKQFTDLHEELFPNRPIETKMDLHNNQVGIHLFNSMLPTIHRQFFETNFFVVALEEKVKSAVPILSLEQTNDIETLIYIKDKASK